MREVERVPKVNYGLVAELRLNAQNTSNTNGNNETLYRHDENDHNIEKRT